MESTTMNTNTIKLIAGLAWAGAALSSAAPAEATFITLQGGSYATCSPESQSLYSETNCPLAPGEPEPFQAYYKQTIRFIATGCSAGGCSQDTYWQATDFLYGTGRKVANLQRNCQGSNQKLYGLGTCSC
jgi:hypothetical protein